MGEEGRKAQISSYKTSKSGGHSVQHGDHVNRTELLITQQPGEWPSQFSSRGKKILTMVMDVNWTYVVTILQYIQTLNHYVVY